MSYLNKYRMVWALLIAFLFFTSNAMAAAVGTVLASNGSVQAVSGTVKRELSRGSQVFTGEDIITAADSSVQIRFTDNGLVSLKSNADYRVDSYEYKGNKDKKDSMAATIVKGKMLALTGEIAHENPKNYVVKSKVATIGITGTYFSTEMKEDSQTLDVFHGTIIFSTPKGSILVGDGTPYHSAVVTFKDGVPVGLTTVPVPPSDGLEKVSAKPVSPRPSPVRAEAQTPAPHHRHRPRRRHRPKPAPVESFVSAPKPLAAPVTLVAPRISMGGPYVSVGISRDDIRNNFYRSFDYTNVYTGYSAPSTRFNLDSGASAWDGFLALGFNHVWNNALSLGVEVFGDISNANREQLGVNEDINLLGGSILGSSYQLSAPYSMGLSFLPGFYAAPGSLIFIDIGYVNTQFRLMVSGVLGSLSLQRIAPRHLLRLVALLRAASFPD